jgi:hypothetical protein
MPDVLGVPDVSVDAVYVKDVDDPAVVMYTDSLPAAVPR